ncbi:multidrug effflux MFS transporter [Thalassotalea profundi]|uniref:Bcr/CflA family efflux transporter n=1 Tax=Thalassotalea profundi TaxID=2036687 RepID=A0ABQ3IMR3_9GAMM|nr:multidrug effflux MFS transporter [Thalassotalea profundi]GHE88968.1 Bcr/CflA family drug resistance efflux transporter [Thalassotalea profundi]
MEDNQKSHVGIAAVLAFVMALGPFALDTYLPAFPFIAETMNTSVHQVSLSISLYVFVLAIGQLSGGPLSDYLGRSKVMLTGITIFGIASILLAFSTSLPEFLILRILQAFGGGWATVTIPALVRDRLSGVEAAKFFSLIGLLMILAPAVAPNIGSLLLTIFHWEAIFVFLAIYSVVALILLKTLIFKESSVRPTKENISVWQRYKIVLSIRPAMRFMLTGTFAFSVMLLFITHASFIYQNHFGVTPTVFSLFFSANVVLMLIFNLANRRLLEHYASEQILRWFVLLQGIGILLLILFTLINADLSLFVMAMVLTIGSMGAVFPNVQACYMEFFSKNGGTAAALLGATQFSIAGIIATLSTLMPESLISIILSQAVCSLICITLIWSGKIRKVSDNN